MLLTSCAFPLIHNTVGNLFQLENSYPWAIIWAASGEFPSLARHSESLRLKIIVLSINPHIPVLFLSIPCIIKKFYYNNPSRMYKIEHQCCHSSKYLHTKKKIKNPSNLMKNSRFFLNVSTHYLVPWLVLLQFLQGSRVPLLGDPPPVLDDW